MKTRPFGVALIAILVAIEAILQILGALGLFGISSLGFFAAATVLPAAALFMFAIVILVVGLVELAVSCGLWAMEKWAWVVTLIVLWIDIIFDLLSGIIGSQSWSAVLISLILPVIVLIYLNMPKIREHFSK